MHVLGKVLLGFVVVGAIAAVFLTTMTLDVRTYWQEQVAQARTEYEAMEKDLAIQRAQWRDAQDSLDRVKHDWGNVWLAQNSRVMNPATGAVSIGAGTQQGLGATAASKATNPVVHVFNVNGQESEYVGAFKIQSAQPGAADAVLDRPPFPDENFPSGTWRVRELIPYQYATRFVDVYTKQIEANARLQRMQFDVTRLQDQLTKSQQLLQERVFQLQGDPNLGNPSDLQKKGFVQSIRDGLTERDALLAELHDLRVERLIKLESLNMLLQENQQRIAAFSQQTQSSGGATPLSAAGRTTSPAR